MDVKNYYNPPVLQAIGRQSGRPALSDYPYTPKSKEKKKERKIEN